MNRALFYLVGMLAVASAACTALLLVRIYGSSGSFLYRWLIAPNLMLAWIPLAAALAVRYWWHMKQTFRIRLLIGLLVWLLFLPNAPYMLTDLVHLTYLKSSVPVHFDVLLNAFTAIIALWVGLFAFYLVHEIWQGLLRPAASWMLAGVLLLLCSVGVFLGRFLRYNSWDLFRKPWAIAQDSIKLLEQRDALVFIGVFMLVLSCLYLVFYASVRYRAAAKNVR